MSEYEKLRDELARKIWMTICPLFPYQGQPSAKEAANCVLAITAERTKSATPEMLNGIGMHGIGSMWWLMHKRSALYSQDAPR